MSVGAGRIEIVFLSDAKYLSLHQDAIGASFGLNCGLLFMPLIIARNSTEHGVREGRIPFSAFWVIASVFICGLFIGILGPGISFSN
jgi:hypothetical protein